jgi:DNA-binding MarR family transcriptional regulator
MRQAGAGDLINDFLGSTQVFARAVRNVVEEKLLHEIAPRLLTFSQFRLLKLVAMTNAQTLGDVATFLGVSNAAASKAVDKLVRRGLLLRSEAETDRRAIELSLTEPSRRLLAAYDAAKNRTLAKVFRRLSPKDLRHTAELLDQLAAEIVDHTARPEEICLQCGIYYRKKCLIQQLVQRNCFYHRHKTRKNAPAVAEGKPSP